MGQILGSMDQMMVGRMGRTGRTGRMGSMVEKMGRTVERMVGKMVVLLE
jgi:hypothetical protein